MSGYWDGMAFLIIICPIALIVAALLILAGIIVNKFAQRKKLGEVLRYIGYVIGISFLIMFIITAIVYL